MRILETPLWQMFQFLFSFGLLDKAGPVHHTMYLSLNIPHSRSPALSDGLSTRSVVFSISINVPVSVAAENYP